MSDDDATGRLRSPDRRAALPRCDIFLSHNRKDRAFVRQVADGLELEFGIPHFLDEYAIPVGERFLPWVEDALARSKGCAIFLGRNGWGPTHLWEAEMALARYRVDPEYRLIPVVIGSIDADEAARLGGGAVFREINWVSFDGGMADTAAIEKLSEAFSGEQRASTRGPAVLTPYVLRRISTQWRRTGDASLLYRGRQLAEAQRVAVDGADMAGPFASAFIAASSAAERARTRRFAGIAIVVAAILLVLSLVLLRENQIARSRELGVRPSNRHSASDAC